MTIIKTQFSYVLSNIFCYNLRAYYRYLWEDILYMILYLIYPQCESKANAVL